MHDRGRYQTIDGAASHSDDASLFVVEEISSLLSYSALAGTLGTGLFLSSGKTIANGGPAGSLLAFCLTGSIAYCMRKSNIDQAQISKSDLDSVCCAGEMAVYAPISGGYIHFIERWLHPAVGFAVGWQVCFQYCLFLPSEVIAVSSVGYHRQQAKGSCQANILVSFWDEAFPKWRQAIYMIVMIVIIAGIVSTQDAKARLQLTLRILWVLVGSEKAR